MSSESLALLRPWRWLMSDRYRLAALTLLLVGAGLRFFFLPEARFTGDEAHFFKEATRAALGEWFPWIGPAVTGGPLHHPGGTFYLLMALPLTVCASPLAAMSVVVALNTFAYGLLGAMVRRLMGSKVALAFLALMVFSPWSFFYSDRIWNSNLVLVVSALFLWGLMYVVTETRSRKLFWVVFALVVFPQFHLSVPLLVFVGLVVVVLFRPRLHWRAGLLGLGAGLALYIPYFVHEWGSGFKNTKLFLTGLGTGGAGAPEALRSLFGFLTLPTGEMSYFAERGFWWPHHQFYYYTGGSFSYSAGKTTKVVDYASGDGLFLMADFFGGGASGWFLVAIMALSVLLAVVALFYALVYGLSSLRSLGTRAREWNPLAAAFLAALAAAPLIFLTTGKPYYPHYIYSLYPLAFVPLLLLFRRLFRSRLGGITIATIIGILAAGQTIMTGIYYDKVDGVVGVRSSGEIVDVITEETGGIRKCGISFRVEKSRLNPGPLLEMARWERFQPLRHDRRARLQFRVFSPDTWAEFQALPNHRQRIAGRRVKEHRELSNAILAWGD